MKQSSFGTRSEICRWTSAGLLIAVLLKNAFGQESHLHFEDVYSTVGGRFSHVSPFTEERHIHLTMGSGVGCLDFDHDGWVDLCFGQGCAWNGRLLVSQKEQDALLRNTRGLFENVSHLSGITCPYYTMAVCCGDSNNDGFDDLFLTSLGQNLLFINNGDGTFAAGLPAVSIEDSYSASCTWTDADNDSNPDLFVCRYVEVSEAAYPLCVDDATKLGVLCPPWKFKATPDLLLLNQGDGTFSDNSQLAGLRSVDPLPGLAVATTDTDEDGDLDIYVANDSVPNHLWLNDGSGHFSEDGLLAGVALNGNGEREAGMGVAVGDATGDGRVDLVVTNYFDETNTFYRNEGQGFFLDVTDELGIGAPSRSKLAFGVNLIDADADMDLDLFVANGHVHDRLPQLGRNIPYQQSAQMLLHENGRYNDCSSVAGKVFSRPLVGRGSAILDFNRDLKTDLVMTNLGGKPLLLENRTAAHGNVVKLRLVGRHSARNPIGARIEVRGASEQKIVRFVDGSTSYLSTSEPTVTIGIAGSAGIPQVEVKWPNGKKQIWSELKVNEEWMLVEGVDRPFRLP